MGSSTFCGSGAAPARRMDGVPLHPDVPHRTRARLQCASKTSGEPEASRRDVRQRPLRSATCKAATDLSRRRAYHGGPVDEASQSGRSGRPAAAFELERPASVTNRGVMPAQSSTGAGGDTDHRRLRRALLVAGVRGGWRPHLHDSEGVPGCQKKQRRVRLGRCRGRHNTVAGVHAYLRSSPISRQRLSPRSCPTRWFWTSTWRP